MPKPTKQPHPRQKADDINLAELKAEDFAPVKRAKVGKALAKLATLPKPKN